MIGSLATVLGMIAALTVLLVVVRPFEVAPVVSTPGEEGAPPPEDVEEPAPGADTLVVDKTGTLTRNEMTVIPNSNGIISRIRGTM